jgi:hypothetical protein
VGVVDDLVADVDGRAVGLEGLLDDQHGAVDAGAEAAGRREQERVWVRHVSASVSGRWEGSAARGVRWSSRPGVPYWRVVRLPLVADARCPTSGGVGVHIIVGGCGRLGAEIAEQLSDDPDNDIVVVDVDPWPSTGWGRRSTARRSSGTSPTGTSSSVPGWPRRRACSR